jgi:two-component system, cell cycle sensor histidine kinase and response regulator CckA
MNDKCILIAEDDSIIRRTTVNALKPYGYYILEAIDGHEALEVSRQYEGDIDLLITNVTMPRMHGHELARQIKQHRPDIRILIVSGFHEREFPPEAVNYSDALVKPVEPEIIARKVNQLLNAV